MWHERDHGTGWEMGRFQPCTLVLSISEPCRGRGGDTDGAKQPARNRSTSSRSPLCFAAVDAYCGRDTPFFAFLRLVTN